MGGPTVPGAAAHRSVCPIQSGAGEQLHFSCGKMRLDPVAIELHLVQPVRSFGRRGFQGCECRGNEARHDRGLRPGSAWLRSLDCFRLFSPAISSLVRPDLMEAGAVSKMSPSAVANSSLALISSQFSRFSFSRPLRRTRCQLPLSFLPTSAKLKWPFFIPAPDHLRDSTCPCPTGRRTRRHRTLGNGAFEIRIVEGMVLDMDGEALFRGIKTGTACYSPTPQYTFVLEAQIIMQPPGIMFVNDK